MPDTSSHTGLPAGYKLYQFGGKVYAVYKVKLANGKYVYLSWRVSEEDFKALGINKDKVQRATKAQFHSFQFFGDISQIVKKGKQGEHPFMTYLRETYETYGKNMSWLNNKEIMELWLMAWAEGWDPGRLTEAMKHTKWYQSRTAYQREWEMDLSRADRKAKLDLIETQLRQDIQDMWGPTFSWQDIGIDDQKLKKWAEQIASGKFGSPEDGYQMILQDIRDMAEKVEGSQAWIDQEQQAEEQRNFMNRPEDMLQQLMEDARMWLGPNAVPDQGTLEKWAKGLVSGNKSEADWLQWLEGQSKALYPWLAPGEAWQDRASSYKSIIEQELGIEVGWDYPLLAKIGAIDPNGKPTGEALNYQDFIEQVRQTNDFWEGPVAKEEGFGLLSQLNYVFNGVQ